MERKRKKELNKANNKIIVKNCHFFNFRLCKHQVFIEEQTGQKTYVFSTVQYRKTMCTVSYIKTQVYIIEQENLDGLFEYIYLSDHEILKSTLYSVHTNNQLYSKQIMCTVHFTHDE